MVAIRTRAVKCHGASSCTSDRGPTSDSSFVGLGLPSARPRSKDAKSPLVRALVKK
ncbi:MAG: hypothetical protein PHG06_22945 [Parabacteroides sp.]|nr:hypothetical protein [Parabacteroides sp.]